MITLTFTTDDIILAAELRDLEITAEQVEEFLTRFQPSIEDGMSVCCWEIIESFLEEVFLQEVKRRIEKCHT